MGARPARITAEDFLIPPELADSRLAADGAGRIGGVRLGLTAVDQQTRVTSCYQQVPLRALSFPFAPSQPALVYLLNPTAGLFDGDAQWVDLEAGTDTRAVITGQSATRIHPSVRGLCTQQWTVRVAAGAVLVVLPGPAIPFQGCRYYQRIAVDLAEEAHVVWGDVWFAGRYARGAVSEQFQFRTLVQDLTVQRAGELVFRDRFCWQGPWDVDTAAWHFSGAPAYGNVFVSAELPHDAATATGLKQAQFTTACRHTVLRWLGPGEAVTQAVVQTALTAAARLSSSERPWLGMAQLAPNHWFSNWQS